MPSVVGLLEQHELAARRRVERLREEADRIQAELTAAEEEWQEWAIARRRVGTVLAPDGGSIAVEEVVSGPVSGSTSRQAARARSQVPVWREGWPGRCCRSVSASSPRSRTGTGSIKVR